MNKKILKLLYRSFDTPLNEYEEKKLKKALAESEGLRKEKERVENLRGMITESGDSSFSPFFADKVMREINTLSEETIHLEMITDWLSLFFKRVAIAGAVVAAILIFYNLKDASQVSLAEVFNVPEITVEEIVEPVFTLEIGEYQ